MRIKLKGKKKAFQANPHDVATLVTYLDGYAALSVIDPAKIQRIIKRNLEDRDIAQVWGQIETDVSDIATLPSSSDEIMHLAKRVDRLKPISMFLPLILLIAYIVLGALGLISKLGILGAVGFLVFLGAAYAIGIYLYISSTRKLSKVVAKYYDRHEATLSKQRRRIKLANQRLIDKIAMEIRSRDRDPEKYRFELLHNDYANIRVLSEDKNSVYTVTVKGKSLHKSED